MNDQIATQTKEPISAPAAERTVANMDETDWMVLMMEMRLIGMPG